MTKSSRLFRLAVFTQWRLVAVLTDLESLRTDNKRLIEKLGKQSASIWTMKKAELVEIARQELGMTRAKAEQETVVSLRERIRAAEDNVL